MHRTTRTTIVDHTPQGTLAKLHDLNPRSSNQSCPLTPSPRRFRCFHARARLVARLIRSDVTRQLSPLEPIYAACQQSASDCHKILLHHPSFFGRGP